MHVFQLVALTPPSLPDPAIAIAASRAGGLGVFNLEGVVDAQAAHNGLMWMARHAGQAVGVRLDSAAPDLIDSVLDSLPEAIQVVIFTAAHPDPLPSAIQRCQAQGRRVWLEVTSVEQARQGEAWNVDSLIAKGHEAGGWVGGETSFILLQRLLSQTELPIYVQGGIGIHTAAACAVAGAAGVVLDFQLALTRESQLPNEAKTAIATMDGSETTCLGLDLGLPYRVYTRPRLPAVEELQAVERALAQDTRPRAEVVSTWRDVVAARVGWGSSQHQVWPLGQDAAFAAPLAARYSTVGGVLDAIRQAVDSHMQAARALRPLDEGAALARSHGTRYPIVQGPMTRVSDRAEFALRVAEGGALPLLALAQMRAPEVEALLQETQQRLSEQPWGVGILGFVPADLRQEQLEVIRRYRPPFALIAGGRPDQARSLEQDGITTYLHVPSVGLLRLFLKDGARRFVFEGRECGGHVGPLSSFVLWNTMVDVLLEALPGSEAANCHVLFAGGIHDARSASMVAALAAPLAERGVRVGVLLGTAYLFTQESVTSGAIVSGYQDEALRCQNTVLVVSGPGHAIRCVETPYVKEFDSEKRRLVEAGQSPEAIRQALEDLNTGRLRMATKGINRHPRYGQDQAAPKFISLDQVEQQRQGMYMIGQVAAMRDQVISISELHYDVAVEGTKRIAAIETSLPLDVPKIAVQSCPIAIVGMSCILPKAPDLATYWDNILNKLSAITEVPKQRWDWELFFDADPKAKDKIYSKWGGFIDDEAFDPLEYGMPPNSLPSVDPMQLLALKAAGAALADAGYLRRAFDRSRVGVILGTSSGLGELGTAYALRSLLPLLFGKTAADVVESSDGVLPSWTEDSFAGYLPNVVAGRIANRLDFTGVNYIVDAACASSLAALDVAVKELETNAADMIIAGGFDTAQDPFGYTSFAKTHALSPTGQSRTFDASSDGIAISEGFVMLVLKRLADAERDGDRIYAVIRGVAGSSDGRAKGLTAPRPEGQMLALQRAYARAGVEPTTVDLFEAHGTGTVVGDQTEATTLSAFLESSGSIPAQHAIGSVKSMIGHTKAAAGVAGLAKAALALYHKVLPPTIGVTIPTPKARFGEGPLYINSEARPWIHSNTNQPRRAGVSAFGFGGTNFHAVVEEYTGDFLPRPAVSARWPSELFAWSAVSRQALLAMLESLDAALRAGAQPELADLAYSVLAARQESQATSEVTLAIVATSLEDLQQKLQQARAALTSQESIHDPRGIYFTTSPLGRTGKLAFLFPGQGSQYPNMLRDLALYNTDAREIFERTDRVLDQCFPRPLSKYIFPPPAFRPEEEQAQQRELTQTNIAQAALGAAEMALLHVLGNLGVRPDMVAGHSYGEHVALYAAGALDLETLAILSEARGRCILEAAQHDLGTMAAVRASRERVAELIDGMEEVWISNLNAPEQVILSGTHVGIERAVECLQSQGLRAQPLQVACAFHSPLVAPAQAALAEYLSEIEFSIPQIDVFSNVTATRYPRDPQAIRELLADHLVQPVRFGDEIEAMYAAGARIFLEVGPRNVLVGLTDQILGQRPHIAIASDSSGRSGIVQLQHALGQLIAHGVRMDHTQLFQGRPVRRINLNALVEETSTKPLPATTWMLNGGQARPLHKAAQPASSPPFSSLALPASSRNGHAAQPVASSEASTKAGVSSNGMTAPRSAPLNQPQAVPTAAAAPTLLPLQGQDMAPPTDEAGQVMLHYQQLMSQFLDTQRNVMLAYLQGTAASGAAVNGHHVASPALPEPLQAPAQASAPSPLVAVDMPRNLAAQQLGSETAESPVESVNKQATTELMIDAAQIAKQFLQIVSERTGYPADILDLDVDIEAELGIDSIKRVEIIGALRHIAAPANGEIDPAVMEQLTTLKTLRAIIDRMVSVLSAHTSDGSAHDDGGKHKTNDVLSPAENLPQTQIDAVEGSSDVWRSSFVAVATPTPSSSTPRFPADRILLITDDERGIAQHVAEQIRTQGGRAVVLRLGSVMKAINTEIYQADLTDATATAEVIEFIRRQAGPIGGIIHLLPLREGLSFEEMDLGAWRERMRRDVKSLYYLARAAVKDFKSASVPKETWLVAATALGSDWAISDSIEAHMSDDFSAQPGFPGHGGLAGLVKTLAAEWPIVRCKVVDLDLQHASAMLATSLLQELAAEDQQIDVGYRGTRRYVLQQRPAPLDRGESNSIVSGASQNQILHSDSVVLITGGARGITAEIAGVIAQQYRPTLIIAGQSALPEAEESPVTAHLTSAREIKAALMDQMRQRGEQVALAQVEAAYNRLLKQREIRRNLALLRRTGATIQYEQVDVRDEDALVRLIERIEHERGHLDGVIHGAGVIEDKLIEDKSPDIFDRVFDTKADSAFILSRVLSSERLKFLALFSSVASQFGNRGQSDYATANAVLNKLAAHLDSRWPGRVVAIGWGPWANTGMLSIELQRQFVEQGRQLIAISAGCQAFDDELRRGLKGQAEIIIVGEGWSNIEREGAVAEALAHP